MQTIYAAPNTAVYLRFWIINGRILWAGHVVNPINPIHGTGSVVNVRTFLSSSTEPDSLSASYRFSDSAD